MEKIEKLLFTYQDLTYRDFASKLAPNVGIEHFIGVRVPILRKLVNDISKEDAIIFLEELPHFYYEENLLHGFIIQKMKDYDSCINYINKFLPFVDNWAVSDTMMPKVFSKHKIEVLNEINKWINSCKTYTIRFGILVLMNLFLDNDFKEEYLYIVSSIKSSEYYVNMMIAWYFATALAKQWDNTIKLLENKVLDKWVHNKTIQKAIESYRITNEQKVYLRTLKY